MTPEPSLGVPLRRDPITAEDHDPEGRFLYPGDVENAMPEGHLAWALGVYLVQVMMRLVVDPSRDSAHANMPIYYVQGAPRRHVSPDAFYLPGVPLDVHRRSYCTWKTGVVPRVVFEVVSRGCEHKDAVANRARYQELGVEEYYWFEPEQVVLTALRLHPPTGRYRKARPDRAGRYRSPALGLEVGLDQGLLALFADGRPVPGLPEALAAAEDRLSAQERRIAELEAELRRARGLEPPQV